MKKWARGRNRNQNHHHQKVKSDEESRYSGDIKWGNQLIIMCVHRKSYSNHYFITFYIVSESFLIIMLIDSNHPRFFLFFSVGGDEEISNLSGKRKRLRVRVFFCFRS